jgi:hypothetical protein
MTNDKSGQQDFAAPAKPQNQAPDQAALHRNIQKAQREGKQGGGLRVEKNRQDKFAQRGPES